MMLYLSAFSLGAGIGAMSAMLFHQRIIKKEERL